MVDRKYVLTLRKALNDLSLTAFVAGITRMSFAIVQISDKNAL